MLIQWKKEYLVGHPLIDFDHQTLVTITNELFANVENGVGRDAVEDTMRNLNDYIERHFAREESLFLDSEYPQAQAHMKKHREIEKVFREIEAAYKQDPRSIDLDEVLDFLKNWLTRHILRTDRDYMPFVKAAEEARNGS